MFCDLVHVKGSRAGGQEEGRAGENQEPEEKVQTENPGEHRETETRTAEEETDEEKTDEKEESRAGHSMKTASCKYCTEKKLCSCCNIWLNKFHTVKTTAQVDGLY